MVKEGSSLAEDSITQSAEECKSSRHTQAVEFVGDDQDTNFKVDNISGIHLEVVLPANIVNNIGSGVQQIMDINSLEDVEGREYPIKRMVELEDRDRGEKQGWEEVAGDQ
ncbi:hypothetical protein A2U01_0002506 [Trifolium medium]|uniref:Uncharacterized protein n=1 Tax=Trifolium medium TaxID=97028 RepID=A0A392M5P7_9FABA|nr:hypothetical protein [Trifolium medium]